MVYRWMCWMICLLSLMAVRGQGTASGSFRLPEYEKIVLANGLIVYLCEAHETPTVSFSMRAKAGSVFDGRKNGLAQLTANCLELGTKSRSKDSVENLLDFYGASLNIGAGREFASAMGQFTVASQDKILPLIADVLMNPRFDEAEFGKRKSRYLRELDELRESPRQVMGDYWHSMMFAGGPLANPVAGTKASIAAMQVADLKAFWQQYYAAPNCVISIVGDFKIEAMEKQVRQFFGDWHKGKTVEIPVWQGEKNTQSNVWLIDRKESIETTFYIGAISVPRNNPDYVEISVINTILGGRFTSLLNRELRVNSGLTYGARSSFLNLSKNGSFAISTFTKTSTTTEAIDLALKVFKGLPQAINDTILTSAKNYVKGQFPPKYETAADLASFFCEMHIYGINNDFISQFEKKVDAMTSTRAQEIIQKYFTFEHLQFLMISRADDIRAKVGKYGTVIEKKIETDSY